MREEHAEHDLFEIQQPAARVARSRQLVVHMQDSRGRRILRQGTPTYHLRGVRLKALLKMIRHLYHKRRHKLVDQI